MTEFTIEIAGVTIAVSALHDATREFCRDYLSGGTPRFHVTLTQADIDREREISAREDRLEGHRVRDHADSYLETIALQRRIARQLLERDVLLFHGSAVAVDGECYLFTAKSGTGKSTHTRFWRELFGNRAVMVNDDKPFLGIGAEGVTVYGSPWDGKHHLSANISVPLKAICVLERGDCNRIAAVSPGEILPMLLQQSHRPADPRIMGRYLELLDGLARGAAFYRLQCTPEPGAAVLSYGAMSGKNWQNR